MGYVISEDVFTGPKYRDIFKRYDFQVLLLFSDYEHQEFSKDFKKRFKDMHEETGERVVFFAATKVPMDYSDWRHDQDSFKEDQLTSRKELTPELDRLLLHEFSRRFGLRQEELPAVVISGDLSRPPYTVIPHVHCAEDAASILQELVLLSRFCHEKNINGTRKNKFVFHHIGPCHSGIFCIVDGQGRELAARLQLLAEADISFQGDDLPRWARHGMHGPGTRKEFRQALQFVVKAPGCKISSDEDLDLDVAGFQALQSIYQGRDAPDELQWADQLDPESRLMLHTSIRVSEYLSSFKECDFAPAVAGFWKAVEREYARSILQVFRKNKGVPIPEYFDLFFPETGDFHMQYEGNSSFNLNARLRNGGTRLKWPTLGVGRLLLEASLKENHAEALNYIGTYSCLDVEAIVGLMRNLNKIRNSASHTNPLQRRDKDDVLRIVGDEGLLVGLSQIKAKLRGAHCPVAVQNRPPYPSPEETLRLMRKETKAKKSEQLHLKGMKPSKQQDSSLFADKREMEGVALEILPLLAERMSGGGRKRSSVEQRLLVKKLELLIAELELIRVNLKHDCSYRRNLLRYLDSIFSGEVDD